MAIREVVTLPDIDTLTTSNINDYDIYGYTPIMHAAQQGNTHLMEHMINLGANIRMRAISPNYQEFVNKHPGYIPIDRVGWTVASFAMKGMSIDALTTLLTFGYNVNEIGRTLRIYTAIRDDEC